MSRAGIAALSKERETVLSKHPAGSKNQENHVAWYLFPLTWYCDLKSSFFLVSTDLQQGLAPGL